MTAVKCIPSVINSLISKETMSRFVLYKEGDLYWYLRWCQVGKTTLQTNFYLVPLYYMPLSGAMMLRASIWSCKLTIGCPYITIGCSYVVFTWLWLQFIFFSLKSLKSLFLLKWKKKFFFPASCSLQNKDWKFLKKKTMNKN